MPFVDTNSHKISYFDSSVLHQVQNEKPPILMVHGLGSSQNYYMPVISQLADKYRCIALDTYGAARSRSQGEALTLEGLADDVIGVMDGLKIKKAVLVGHSMGGTMVCTIAAKNPDRVVGIVPIGPVSPKHVNPGMFKTRIETVLKDGMEPLADSVPSMATSAKSTPLQRAMIRELLSGQDPKLYASHCQVIVDAKEPDFSNIKVPVRILAGAEDKSAPMEGSKYICEHIASSQKHLVVIEDCGHWHCIEASERVATEIDDFCFTL